ncbi:hypothetical protein QTP88_021918 [Uroleucon formosanum]
MLLWEHLSKTNSSKSTSCFSARKTIAPQKINSINKNIKPNPSPDNNKENTTSTNPKIDQNETSSFAKITSKSTYPKKGQPLIIEIKDKIQQQDYVFAIAEIMKPENIIFISRISKDRFCIFLSSVKLVEKVLNQPK